MPEPDKLQWRSSFGWPSSSPAGRADPKRGLVIHYDSANQSLAAKPHSACVAYWKRTRSFHTGPSRGWADIGYSWGACAHGYVMEGRGLFRAQAAQPGGNSTYYSVTLMTGPNDTVTPEQINAVRQLREWLMEPASSIARTVKGHRDFIATSCPGTKAYRMVRDGTFTKPATWGGAAPDTPATSEDDMPDRRYLSTADPTTLKRGEWTQIQLGDPNEWSLAGVSSKPQIFTAEAGWRIEGLSEGDEYQVRLCNYDPPKGGGSWRQAGGRRISEHRHKEGLAIDSRTFVGRVTADQRVRVQIKQWTSDDARVVSTNSDVLTWDE